MLVSFLLLRSNKSTSNRGVSTVSKKIGFNGHRSTTYIMAKGGARNATKKRQFDELYSSDDQYYTSRKAKKAKSRSINWTVEVS